MTENIGKLNGIHYPGDTFLVSVNSVAGRQTSLTLFTYPKTDIAGTHSGDDTENISVLVPVGTLESRLWWRLSYTEGGFTTTLASGSFTIEQHQFNAMTMANLLKRYSYLELRLNERVATEEGAVVRQDVGGQEVERENMQSLQMQLNNVAREIRLRNNGGIQSVDLRAYIGGRS